MLEVLGSILNRAKRDLDEINARYALIGGLAIGARTQLRFTQDADLTVAVQSDTQAEQIAGHLIRSGYQIMTELDHAPTGRIGVLRLVSPVASKSAVDQDELPLLDLLIHSTGIEKEVVSQAQVIEVFSGVRLPTATIPHLIAMKVLSESDRRLQDRIDLQNLIAVAEPAELEAVPDLLSLIEQRGFANGKDLPAIFEKFLDEHHEAQS